MDGDGDGSSISGDVSSSMATDEVVPPADDPELPQPNAWPPTMGGPTENDAAFLQQFARRRYPLLGLSRLPSGGGPNAGHSAIFFDSDTPDDGGGGDPRHGDYVDAADADANGNAGGDHHDDDDDDGDSGDDDDDGDDGFGFSFGAVPASGVAVACLPETTAGEGEARESGQQCAVCLEEYEAGDALRTMPCAHGFHERCIFEWLRASRFCPLCRLALPPEEEGTERDVEVGRDDQGEAHDDDGSEGPLDNFDYLFVT